MTNIGPVSNGKLEQAKKATDSVQEEFFLRNKKIRVDENGFVSLNDIHKASGFRTKKRPYEWARSKTTHDVIIALHERITGNSRNSKFRTSLVLKTASGTNGGSWAHPILAAGYAGYLKPELEVEMREVWLRYRSADPKLADEVLQRATDDQNEWAATRAISRVKRSEFTKALDDHGVSGFGFANCTNAVYQPLFDATAKKLKKEKGLPDKANLRNSMSKDELVFVMMAETLAKGRIEDEKPSGNGACAKATKKSASFVRQAIDMDRNDRQKPLEM